jgi:hypothetical protein
MHAKQISFRSVSLRSQKKFEAKPAHPTVETTALATRCAQTTLLDLIRHCGADASVFCTEQHDWIPDQMHSVTMDGWATRKIYFWEIGKKKCKSAKPGWGGGVLSLKNPAFSSSGADTYSYSNMHNKTNTFVNVRTLHIYNEVVLGG